MPDPGSVNYEDEIIVGYENVAEGFDQYGKRPWEEDYGKDPRRAVKYDPLYRFKGEFARYHGPKKRGLAMEDVHMTKSDEYSEDMHNYHLKLSKKKRS